MAQLLRLCSLWFICLGIPLTSYSQPALQEAGTICCDQNLCPGDSFPLITEWTATTPSDSLLNLEFSWFTLVTDSSSPSGTKWVKLPNTNSKTYLPNTLGTPFGGFFMRAVREVGTLPYLFSNVVSYVQLSASSPDCMSSSSTEATLEALQLFPNPTHSTLKINLGSSGSVLEYQILSTMGIPILQVSALPAETQEISVEHLPPGTYLLQITSQEGKRSIHPWIKM